MEAQDNFYATAFSEIRQGRKRSHWMWFIFPQIAGFGFSETSRYYAIKNLQEAEDFLKHPVLGSGLKHMSRELLKLETNDARQVFGSPDDLKLHSSMTLSSLLPETYSVFPLVLEKFFNGEMDMKTFEIIS